MKKRFISILCVMALILSVLPTTALAVDPDFTLRLEVEATEGATGAKRTLNDLRKDDIVTVRVIVPGSFSFIGAQVSLQFDNTKFQLASKPESGLKPAKTDSTAGWDSVQTTTVSNANRDGKVSTAGVGTRLNEYDEVEPGNYEMTEEWAVLTVRFKVNTDEVGTANFSICDHVFSRNINGTDTDYTVGIPASVSTTVVQELSDVTLTGSVTKPAKGGKDTSSVTSTNVTAAVSWTPALEDGKFAAGTKYTATVTVKPKVGYVFADDMTVSGLAGYAFEKQNDGSYRAERTYDKTDEKSLTNLEMTSAPAKTTYTHGDIFDKSGMKVRATYDDGSVNSDFAGYSIDKTVVKYGDTKVVLTCGTIQAEQAITVEKKKLTISGIRAINREYNGTTEVELAGGALAGVLPGETVTAEMPKTGIVADANMGIGKSVMIVTPTLSGVDAGSYTLTDVTGVTVDISARTAEVIWTKANSYTYTGSALTAPTAEYVGNNGSKVSCTVTSSKTFKDAGEYIFTATTTDTNYALTNNTTDITVEKAALSDVRVAQNGGLTYNGIAHVAGVTTNATAKGGEQVTFTYSAEADGKYGDVVPSFTDAGEYTVYYKADAKNHNTASGSFKVTIAKAAAPTGIAGEVTLYHADNKAGVFAASALKNTPNVGWTDARFVDVGSISDASVISSVSVSSGKLSYAPTGTAGAGKTETVTATVSSKNYENATVKITFKTVDISIDWDEIGRDNITLKSAPVYGDKNSDILTIKKADYTAQTTVDVPGTLSVKEPDSYPVAGITTVTLVFTPAANTGISGIFTHDYTIPAVKAKPITVTANAASAVYGADIPTLDFTVPAGALVGNDTKGDLGLTLTTSAAKGSNVGSYDITKQVQTSTNYMVTVNGAKKLTITAKPLATGMVQDIASVTYNGAAQTPGVTVVDGATTLTRDTDYTVAYSSNTDAGTARVTVTGKGNYSGSAEKNFTIDRKDITVASVTLQDKTYNGKTDDAVVAAVAFNGLVDGQTLALGTDYAATAVYNSADAGDSVAVKATIMLKDTEKAKNYSLTNGTGFAASGKINKAATTLSLTAMNAVYTGKPYEEKNIKKTSNVETSPAYAYYANEACTQPADPVNVGTYWVKGTIGATTNNTSAEAKASFCITKAPLTIKANDKTITYGDVPANDGVTYTGLVNSEVGAAVAPGLDYAYNYEQFGNAGTYVITPKGADAANYDITFQTGKLTVAQKEVGLTWKDAGTLYYNGKAKNVTATATGLVNGDEVTVTVAGGKQTEIGVYSAAATGLTGVKAGSYKLPENRSAAYTITTALTSVTVTPETVTATIDGLTVKLTGYRTENETLTVTGNGSTVAAGGKLTVNGVEYTVDDSAVVVKPADISVNPSQTEIRKADDADASVTDEILDAIRTANTKGEGLEKAAAALLESVGEGKPEGTAVIEVTFVLKIQPKIYEHGKLTLVVEPYLKRVFKDANGAPIGEAQETKIANSELNSLVTVSVKLPDNMPMANLFAKHDLGGGKFEYLSVTVDHGVAIWQQSSFSEVTLASDSRSATITFQKADGSTVTKTYTVANLGEALPTDSRTGYTFRGWKLGDAVYSGALTDEMLTALNGTKTLTAEHTQNSSGGGGGGGAATYPVSVDKTENGVVTVSPKSAAQGSIVTIETKANAGYELASVTVLDKNGKEITVTVKDGKYSFVMPNGKVSIQAEFTKKNVMSFADIPANEWYYSAVKYCFDNGLMNGVGEDRFAPSVTTTRAMIWTVLARNAGVDTSSGENWYEAGRKWAVENRISDGTAADSAITREQFATMLYRVAQSRGEGFTGTWYFPLSFDDAASISDWADEAMHWCVMKGILNGNDNKLRPADSASRAEVAAMLMRFLTLDK